MPVSPDDPTDPAGSELTRGYKKRERTREQLIVAGLTVLAEKGEALTVSDVVLAAKVSNGTFYNYFADRDALLSALAGRSLFEFIARVRETTDAPDPALRIAVVTTRVLDAAASDPSWGRILLRLAETPDTSQSRVGQQLKSQLELGFEQGRFTAPPDLITMDLVFGLVSLSVRRLLYVPLPGDHPQRVVERLMVAIGLARHDAVEIARQASEITSAPL